jgi:two-component system, chemotaxis family, sensor kinase CheA
VSNAGEKSLTDDLIEYVAECDEHLSTARAILLDSEVSEGSEGVGQEGFDALFRAFHTIKGLSGMVGARVVEDAAHRLESYLGSLRKEKSSLHRVAVDVLLEGVELLEAAIDAFQGGRPTPDITRLAAQIDELMPRDARERTAQPIADSNAPVVDLLPEGKRAKIDVAQRRGDRCWLLTFAPSPSLAARGVNIGSVRSRLQAVGEIVHAEPVAAPGGVRFRFWFAAPPAIDPFAWSDDGIVAEPFDPVAASLPETASVAKSESGPSASAQLVRVDLRRLDDLLRGVGELVLSRARLESGLSRVSSHLLPRDRHELDEVAHTIERQLRDLREGVMRVRMIPVAGLFTRMRHVVRDLTRELNKDVELILSGEETEVDKYIVDRMADPLLHLVRNAISHGLESAEERAATGKPARGRLSLRASAAAGMLVLEVEDDGRGIRAEEVFARGRDLGLIAPDVRDDPATLLDLLCTPGFSTRDQADRASGRGVGMDVARLAVESLGGSLSLETRPGAGCRFTARLPLTLLVADVITISVGDQIYAIPQGMVHEVVSIEPDSLTILERNEFFRYRGGVLPLVRLAELLGAPRSAAASPVALVTGEGASTVGLAADRAIGLREVVVRQLADPLIQVQGISGATELGDGRPILILDPGGLIRLSRRGALSSPVARGSL